MKVIFVILILVDYGFFSKLPATFTKCNKSKPDFDQCLSQAITDAIRQLNQPMALYGLPNLDPFVVPGEGVRLGNRSTGLEESYSNVKTTGLSKIDTTNARIDFSSNILSMEMYFPRVSFEFDYEAHGKMVLLPVDVLTSGVITYEKTLVRLIFEFETYEKGTDKYFKIVDSNLSFHPQGATFDYRNLFKNKFLNDEFNREMGANWRQIVDVINKKYSKMTAKLFGDIPFGNLLRTVPISELFDEV